MSKRDTERLRVSIERVGGLVGSTDLQSMWDLSRQRVHKLTAAEDFPEPVAVVSGRPVWTRHDVDTWRRRRTGRE